MRQMVSTVQQASQQSQQHIKGIDTTMTQLASTAKSMGAAIGVAFSVTAVVNFGKAVVQSALQMDTLKRSIDAAAGSVQTGAQQMEFLRGRLSAWGSTWSRPPRAIAACLRRPRRRGRVRP